jgi:hypothetical protein
VLVLALIERCSSSDDVESSLATAVEAAADFCRDFVVGFDDMSYLPQKKKKQVALS